MGVLQGQYGRDYNLKRRKKHVNVNSLLSLFAMEQYSTQNTQLNGYKKQTRILTLKGILCKL